MTMFAKRPQHTWAEITAPGYNDRPDVKAWDERLRQGPWYPAATLARVRRAKKWQVVAHHEAGHAVGMLALGPRFVDVRLLPGSPELSGSCGATYYPSSSDRRERGLIRACLIAYLAGPAAEKLFTGRLERAKSLSDYAAVAEIAQILGKDEIELQRKYESRAAKFVTDNRDAIAAVADALLASDMLLLTREQVSAIARPLMKRRAAATLSRPR